MSSIRWVRNRGFVKPNYCTLFQFSVSSQKLTALSYYSLWSTISPPRRGPNELMREDVVSATRSSAEHVWNAWVQKRVCRAHVLKTVAMNVGWNTLWQLRYRAPHRIATAVNGEWNVRYVESRLLSGLEKRYGVCRQMKGASSSRRVSQRTVSQRSPRWIFSCSGLKLSFVRFS